MSLKSTRRAPPAWLTDQSIVPAIAVVRPHRRVANAAGPVRVAAIVSRPVRARASDPACLPCSWPDAASATRTPQPGRPGPSGRRTSDAGRAARFPATATRNTFRVGGADPAADAAGVASALYPATSAGGPPHAVVLVDGDDWGTAIAASVLAANADRRAHPAHRRQRGAGRHRRHARPPRPPRVGPLEGRPGDPHRRRAWPGPTASRPRGRGRRPLPSALARSTASSPPPGGRPSLTWSSYSAERAEWAMPAAAGPRGRATRRSRCARTGARRRAPRAAPSHEQPNVFVLGPPEAISEKAVRELRAGAGRVGHADLRPRHRSTTRSPSRATARATSAGASRCPATTSPSPTPHARATRPPPPRWPRGECSRPCCSPTRRLAAAHAGELLPERPARVRGRPRAGGLQPRVDPRRRRGDLLTRAGAPRQRRRADSGAGHRPLGMTGPGEAFLP